MVILTLALSNPDLGAQSAAGRIMPLGVIASYNIQVRSLNQGRATEKVRRNPMQAERARNQGLRSQRG